MTPIGWGAAALVWCYALAWLFVNNEINILTVRWLNAQPNKTPERAAVAEKPVS